MERRNRRYPDLNSEVGKYRDNEENKSRGRDNSPREGRGTGSMDKKEYVPKPMSIGRLKIWAEYEEAGKLVLFMLSERQQLENFLNEPNVKEDWFILLVKALGRALTAQYQSGSLKQLLEILCTTRFFEHFAMYIMQKKISGYLWADAEEFFKIMMDILRDILKKLPQYAIQCITAVLQLLNAVPFVNTIKGNKELLSTLTSLSQEAEEIYKSDKEAEKKWDRGKFCGNSDLEVPPNDFRKLPVVPTQNDFLESTKPFLRSAVINGAYQDTLHYLDVQFRLMREDFIHPLKKGIIEFINSGCQENFAAPELKIYRDVHIFDPVTKDGIVHILHFDVSKLKKVNWEFSKRLLFGSLLCLSKDNFKTLVFATVFNFSRQNLAVGLVNVKIKVGFDIVLNSTSQDVYIMAESTAYYESYCHVLEALQEMEFNFPLQEYIIKCEKKLKPPKYLLPSGGVSSLPIYNISCLMKYEIPFEVPVLTTVKWPDADVMCLNESQREAAQLALTKEMAIIQGPPGTGKTYVGLKVMQALIENKSVMAGNNENRSDPILVVCYTNHALDQFLEGVLEFCPDGIVRVGGSSKSLKLKKFNMKTLKENVKILEQLDISVRKSKFECYRELLEICSEMKCLYKVKNSLEFDLLIEQRLKDCMKSFHWDSLVSEEHKYRSKSIIRVWLHASSYNPQTALSKIIGHHLTNLVLEWKQWSLDVTLTDNMDIVNRASLYKAFLAMYISQLIQEYNGLCAMFTLHAVRRMQTIKDQLDYSLKNILSDDELILPHETLRKMEKSLNGTTTEVPNNRIIFYWLIGPHRSLHAQLNDIKVITESMKQEEAKDICKFGSNRATMGEQDDHFIENVEDLEEPVNYRNDRSFSKSNSMAVMQWMERLGVTNDAEEMLGAMKDVMNNADEMLGVMKDVMNNAEEMLGELEDIMNDTEDINGGWQTVSLTKPLGTKEIGKKLKSIKPMSEEEESHIVNLWALDLNQRFALYNLWITRYKKALIQQMEDHMDLYNSACKRRREINAEEDLRILRRAKVIGMTTTGAAKNMTVLQALGCRIIVVEEAAEVLESHIITTLNKDCKHLILIGDHQQLRPNPNVYELATKFGLEISLFERLIKNHVPHAMLKKQHRMRPEISKLMQHIYPELEDHPSVLAYDRVRGVTKNIFFIQHEMEETHVDESQSKSNIHEAKFLIALCQHLLYQSYQPSQITILTTYAGQMFALKKVVKESNLSSSVRISTVDNFQGEENDIILLSLVRSNTKNNVGFLKIDNRVCVALSRAKKGLFVIGNIRLLASKSKLWTKILKTAEKDEIIGNGLPVMCENHPDFKENMTCDGDFKKYPEGCCGRPCQYKLSCGHSCVKKCHFIDREHKEYKCQKLCNKTCKDGHPCLSKCFQECGDCLTPVSRIIPICGHENEVPCNLTEDMIICSQLCSALLDCEHICTGQCGQCRKDSKHQECSHEVQYSWPCGHINKVPCWRNPSLHPCPSDCVATMDCGHICTGKCSECKKEGKHKKCSQEVQCSLACGHINKVPCWMNPSMYLCQYDCDATLDCGHKCTGKCSECLQRNLHIACEMKFNSVLSCGHKCEIICGAPCLPCKKKCPGMCTHIACEEDGYSSLCGHACTPCMEKCAYGCIHEKCDKLCHELCSVKPCNEPCPNKMLFCEHKCSGLCGQLCVCERCDKISVIEKKGKKTNPGEAGLDHLKERAASLGADQGGSGVHPKQQEDKKKESNTKRLLLKMPSCKHTFYVDELDEYVSSFDPGGSSYLGCPICQKPIMNCWRYVKINKLRSLKREEAKAKLRKGTDVSREELEKLHRSQMLLEKSVFLKRFHNIMIKNVTNKMEMKAVSFQLKCAYVLNKISSYEKSKDLKLTLVESIRDAILRIPKKLTDQQKRESTGQLLRCFFLSILYYLEKIGTETKVEWSSHSKTIIKSGKKSLANFRTENVVKEIKSLSEVLMQDFQESVCKAQVQYDCMLLEKSLKSALMILLSREEEMLCDLMKEEAEGNFKAATNFSEELDECFKNASPKPEVAPKSNSLALNDKTYRPINAPHPGQLYNEYKRETQKMPMLNPNRIQTDQATGIPPSLAKKLKFFPFKHFLAEAAKLSTTTQTYKFKGNTEYETDLEEYEEMISEADSEEDEEMTLEMP